MTDVYVHANAICESDEVGDGSRLWAFSHVMHGAKVGDRCNVGEHVFIESEVVVGSGCTIKNGVALWNKTFLEDDVFVGPYVVFSNDLRPRAFIRRGTDFYLPTLLKRGCSIGSNATLVCGVTIGEYAMVGAGTVVTKDVEAHTLVVGNPMRVIAQICFCGEPLTNKGICHKCELPLEQNSAELAADIFRNKANFRKAI